MELAALRRDGTLVLLGRSPTPRPPPQVFQFIMGRKRLADIDLIAAKDINVAYERMLKSDVKYRFVIDIATITG